MHNGVQFLQAAVAEGEIGEARAVQPTVGTDDIGAEGAHNLHKRRLARLHERAAKRIGFDDLRAQLAQHRGHGRFAAAQAACESDA
jgi:hypothetical protein